MMADDEMLDQRFQRIGKGGDLRQLGLQHFQFNDHVPEQLAASGVRKGAIVSQFVDFADIVQKSASEQQVAINVRIIAAHQVAGTEQRHYVLKQASNESVMQ